MKCRLNKILSVLLIALMIISLFGCQNKTDSQEAVIRAEKTDKKDSEELVIKDYATELKLDMSSSTKKQEVTVNAFIDGDTTHFNVPKDISESGILRARYLAIDTPESTGKIEEYGKAASRFTKETLSKATSIIIESDNDKWNLDSTGGRFLVWVWYKTADAEDYKNLNLEILQNGLAMASSTANNRYGETCMAALNQAKAQKLNVFSGEKDPDYFYGDAIELTLKELRCNTAKYDGAKVAFNGIVSKYYGNGVYVEAYDEETGMYFGIPIYYGFTLSGEGLDILSVGNEVRIVGNLSYYETGKTYQISGLKYRMAKPDDPDNIQKLSEGHKPAYVPITADKLKNGKVNIDLDGEEKTFDYAELALATSVEMDNLLVKSIYTTEKENSSSNGAMTLTCEVDGQTVTVRTTVLKDEDNKIIGADTYLNKTINVKGIIDCFDGEYQIKVLSAKDINII